MPVPVPLVPLVLPKPLPIPEVALALPYIEGCPVSVRGATVDADIPRPPLVIPPLPLAIPRPIPPRTELPLVVGAPTVLCRSSSSAFLRASSLRRSRSAACLSASCCFWSASFSMSCRSWVDPFQSVLRMSRWLCSVCERIRVQVLRRVDALSTVFETV